MLRVLLVDDEALTREALAVLLGLEDDILVVAQASDGERALTQLTGHEVDVAVLDVEMPGMDGIALVEHIGARHPDVRCLLLTRHARPGLVRRALRSGARGFVSKSMSGAALSDVIRKVSSGSRHVDPDLAVAALADTECPLSPRELDVLQLVDGARTATEIGRILNLSSGTIRNYLSSAMTKLGVRDRAAAADLARDSGWI